MLIASGSNPAVHVFNCTHTQPQSALLNCESKMCLFSDPCGWFQILNYCCGRMKQMQSAAVCGPEEEWANRGWERAALWGMNKISGCFTPLICSGSHRMFGKWGSNMTLSIHHSNRPVAQVQGNPESQKSSKSFFWYRNTFYIIKHILMACQQAGVL